SPPAHPAPDKAPSAPAPSPPASPWETHHSSTAQSSHGHSDLPTYTSPTPLAPPAPQMPSSRAKAAKQPQSRDPRICLLSCHSAAQRRNLLLPCLRARL